MFVVQCASHPPALVEGPNLWIPGCTPGKTPGLRSGECVVAGTAKTPRFHSTAVSLEFYAGAVSGDHPAHRDFRRTQFCRCQSERED